MTEQIPPTPETPEVPQQVTVDIQQLAKMMAEESAKAAQDAIATIGLYKTRGEVVAKDADEHVQVRRESALNDDGSAGDPDPGFYPVPSPGTLPQVGDTVWCVGNNGGLVVLGKEADAAYKDLPAVLAVANLALAQPPIGAIMDWGGASDPADGKWLICDGRLLDIALYPDLYAVLGVAFNTGGESVTQFRLPDKRGRVSVGAGQGTSLTNRGRASRFGSETQTLSVAELPVHNHGGATDLSTHSHGGSTGSVTHDHGGTASNSHNHGLDGMSDWTVTDRDAIQDLGGGGVHNVPMAFSWTNHSATNSSSHSHSIADNTHSHSLSINSDSHGHTMTTANTGSGQSHANMQPGIGLHSIIRSKL